MEKGIARQFVYLMADYLDIPSFVCEKMENQLIKGEYEDVINFVVKRKKEIEKKNADSINQIFAQITQEDIEEILRKNK